MFSRSLLLCLPLTMGLVACQSSTSGSPPQAATPSATASAPSVPHALSPATSSAGPVRDAAPAPARSVDRPAVSGSAPSPASTVGTAPQASADTPISLKATTAPEGWIVRPRDASINDTSGRIVGEKNGLPVTQVQAVVLQAVNLPDTGNGGPVTAFR